MNAIIMFFIIGVVLFAALALWIWAIIDCLSANSTAEYKLLWLLVIIFLNVIGAIIYFILSSNTRDISFGSTYGKKRRLTRNSEDKMLAGVCGGIAKYFGIDSSIVRIVFVLLVFFVFHFLGLFLYIVAAIVIPSDRDLKKTNKAQLSHKAAHQADSTTALKSSSHKAKKNTKNKDFVKQTKEPSWKQTPVSNSGPRKVVLFVLLAILFTMFIIVSIVISGFVSYSFISEATDTTNVHEIIKEQIVSKRIDSMNEAETVSKAISESHNFVKYNGHNLVLLGITEPEKEKCSIFQRDPYGLRIYDSSCREYQHRFSTDGTGDIYGYEVTSTINRGEIISMYFQEIYEYDAHFENKAGTTEDRNKLHPSNNYINECLPEQRATEICMKLWEPVCGYAIHPDECPDCGKTFSNNCFACSETDIIYYTYGECV